MISIRRSLNHSASCPAKARATNSDSMVECVIHVCCLDFQEIAPSASVNTQPVVDLLSPILNIELASVYPSNNAEKLE